MCEFAHSQDGIEALSTGPESEVSGGEGQRILHQMQPTAHGIALVSPYLHTESPHCLISPKLT